MEACLSLCAHTDVSLPDSFTSGVYVKEREREKCYGCKNRELNDVTRHEPTIDLLLTLLNTLLLILWTLLVHTNIHQEQCVLCRDVSDLL